VTPEPSDSNSSSDFRQFIGKPAASLYVPSRTKFSPPILPNSRNSPVALAAVPAIPPLHPRVIQNEGEESSLWHAGLPGVFRFEGQAILNWGHHGLREAH
jgi:hypothetical protein